MRVLSARGSELERDYAFALVGQLLDPVIAAASESERDQLFAGAAALAAPVLESGSDAAKTSYRAAKPPGGESEPASQPAGGDPGYAALHGLYWLVSNVAASGPVLLSVDDLHWADAPSLRFLAFLEARIQGMPVVVACARRSTGWPRRRDPSRPSWARAWRSKRSASISCSPAGAARRASKPSRPT